MIDFLKRIFGKSKPARKVLVIDIDGVLFQETHRWDDYTKREPIIRTMRKLRKLKESGEYDFIAYTARRKEEAFWETIRAFQRYGIDDLFLYISFEKPAAVGYVDDRGLSIHEFNSL